MKDAELHRDIVRNNTDLNRYEMLVDGSLAGYSEYKSASDTVTFIHTLILPGYEGKGLGLKLAKAALDDVRGQHKLINPECPFIAAYVRRHQEYLDLVRPELRTQFSA